VQQYPYSVLLAQPEFGPGEATWAVAERLMARGLGVIPAQSTTDLADAMADGPDIGAALVGWDLFTSEPEFHALVDEISDLAPARPPVVLLSETGSEQTVPASATRRADGFFWLPADSPSFVASQVEHLVQAHAEELMSQFLAELTGTPEAGDWISYVPGPDGMLAAAGNPSRCLALPLPARGDLVAGGN
jgi:DNA-binding NtrC family response regulator